MGIFIERMKIGEREKRWRWMTERKPETEGPYCSAQV